MIPLPTSVSGIATLVARKILWRNETPCEMQVTAVTLRMEVFVCEAMNKWTSMEIPEKVVLTQELA
jgi:hypothetical protein